MLLLLGFAGCASPLSVPREVRQQRYEACLSRGGAHLAEADYAQAAQAFEEAVRWVPDASRGQALLGFAYLKLRRTDQAERALLRALTLDPANVPALCNLGVICVKNRRYAEAQSRLEHAAALDPTFAPAQYSLGSLLMHLGDFARARQALARAFELDPTLAMAAPASTVGFQGDMHPMETCLGFARVYAAAGNVEETVRFLEEARRLGFKDWRGLLAEAVFDKVRDQPGIQAFLA
ncbi:MAG TPA: tetratricopeptide repeat protein [Geothrix sp.]|nr:tetratricopeptide repeat protein [Geothrix sp.]